MGGGSLGFNQWVFLSFYRGRRVTWCVACGSFDLALCVSDGEKKRRDVHSSSGPAWWTLMAWCWVPPSSGPPPPLDRRPDPLADGGERTDDVRSDSESNHEIHLSMTPFNSAPLSVLPLRGNWALFHLAVDGCRWTQRNYSEILP